MGGETVSGEPLSDGGMGAAGVKVPDWGRLEWAGPWRGWTQREEVIVCLWEQSTSCPGIQNSQLLNRTDRRAHR